MERLNLRQLEIFSAVVDAGSFTAAAEKLYLAQSTVSDNVRALEELLQTRMGLCGILDREKHPLAAQLIERVVRPGEQALRLACLAALIEVLAEESRGMAPLALRPE